jgi:putative FmdB family regulatory protein
LARLALLEIPRMSCRAALDGAGSHAARVRVLSEGEETLMPTYILKCTECGWKWEEQRPMSEVNNPAVCKNCGGAGQVVINSAPTIPWYPDSTRLLKS